MERSPENLARLQELVLGEMELQEALRAITDHSRFVEAVVRLGDERGLPVAPVDVHDAMNAGRRTWIERWL